MIKVTLFFSYGVSVKNWHESGFLSRELSYYHDLINNNDILIEFLTYGDETDHDFMDIASNIKIIPIYSKIKKPNTKLGLFISSLLIPFHFRKDLASSDFFKTNQIWGSWVAVIAKIFLRKPLLIRAGYDLYKNSIIGEKNGLKLFFIWLISKISYKSANHIWVPTDEISEFVIKEHKITSDKITVFPNWIDVNLFRVTDAHYLYKNKILYIGRLSNEKNIPLLVNALCKTNIALDIIGDGEEKNNIISLANKRLVDINFLGRVPNENLPNLINRYPIIVLCSNYEGSPKVLLEAMSCGKAVIGTNKPGINNVIIHNVNGVLCESDVSSLSSAITGLIKDEKAIQIRK